eukprot:8593270-Lingulodinium_polyedra.AAC.1
MTSCPESAASRSSARASRSSHAPRGCGRAASHRAAHGGQGPKAPWGAAGSTSRCQALQRQS